MLRFGSQSLYEWLATDDQQVDLLQVCPEIVLGKYVAITSIDSGVFTLNCGSWRDSRTPNDQRLTTSD